MKARRSRGGSADAVAGNEAKVAAMLEEDLGGGLVGIDAASVIGDHSTALRGDFELHPKHKWVNSNENMYAGGGRGRRSGHEQRVIQSV